MGLDDLVGKAKKALEGREEQVKGALDGAAKAVKSRTGDRTDAKVDSVVEKAKDALDRQGGSRPAAPRTAQPGTPTTRPGTAAHGPGTDRPTT